MDRGRAGEPESESEPGVFGSFESEPVPRVKKYRSQSRLEKVWSRSQSL